MHSYLGSSGYCNLNVIGPHGDILSQNCVGSDYIQDSSLNIMGHNGFINRGESFNISAYMNGTPLRNSPQSMTQQINYMMTTDSNMNMCYTPIITQEMPQPSQALPNVVYSTGQFYSPSTTIPTYGFFPETVLYSNNESLTSNILSYPQGQISRCPSAGLCYDQDMSNLQSNRENLQSVEETLSISQSKIDPLDSLSSSDELTDDDPNRSSNGPGRKSKKGSGRKEAHNVIERRYRTQINKCFNDLESTIFCSDAKETGTHTKSVILRSAAERIRLLAADNAKLSKENTVLKEKTIGGSGFSSINENGFRQQNGHVPFFIRGNNSSKNVVTFMVTFFSILLYNIDHRYVLKFFNIPVLSSVPYCVVCLSLLCWMYLNWKSESTEEEADIGYSYKKSLDDYRIFIRSGDSHAAISSLLSAFYFLNINFSCTFIGMLWTYLVYVPSVVIYIISPTLWKFISSLFSTEAFLLQGEVDYDDVANNLNEFIGIISNSTDDLAQKRLFISVFKSLYFAISHLDKISERNINKLLVTSSIALRESHKYLARLLLIKAIGAYEKVNDLNSLFSNDAILKIFLSHDSKSYSNWKHVVPYPDSIKYNAEVNFAVYTAEVLFVEYIEYLWSLDSSVQIDSNNTNEISPELTNRFYLTNSALDKIIALLHSQDLPSDFIKDLSRLMSHYSVLITGDTKHFLANVPDDYFSYEFSPTTDILTRMIRETCNSIYHIKIFPTDYPIDNISDLSYFLQSEFNINIEKFPIVKRVIICICSEVMMVLRNSNDLSELFEAIEPLSHQEIIRESLIFSSFCSKFDYLKKKVEMYHSKNLSKFHCNPLLSARLIN